MHQAVLAGGPEHGRRLEIASSRPRYIHLETSGWMPAMFTQPPRPSVWRHPLAWRRWQKVMARPVPDPQSCVYRHNGFLADGTPVYWYGGPDTAPPASPEAVVRHLFTVLNEASPYDRLPGRGHWEMGMEWYTAIRAAPTLSPGPLDDSLFGNPVKITFGSPRYVTRDTP
jgi:hypothetical protein